MKPDWRHKAEIFIIGIATFWICWQIHRGVSHFIEGKQEAVITRKDSVANIPPINIKHTSAPINVYVQIGKDSVERKAIEKETLTSGVEDKGTELDVLTMDTSGVKKKSVYPKLPGDEFKIDQSGKVEIEKGKPKFFVGGGIGADQTGLTNLTPKIAFMNRKGDMYSAGYDVLNRGINVDYLKRISFKRK